MLSEATGSLVKSFVALASAVEQVESLLHVVPPAAQVDAAGKTQSETMVMPPLKVFAPLKVSVPLARLLTLTVALPSVMAPGTFRLPMP